VLVAAAAGGYVLYDAGLRAARRQAEAEGRVAALAIAEVRALPALVDQLGADRGLVRGRLAAMARGDGSGADGRRRLPAALALLADDPAQADFLAGYLARPEATPDEVLVIRGALVERRQADRAAKVLRPLLPAKGGEASDAQLRAAGALTRMAPDDPGWADRAGPLARKLVAENPLYLSTWNEVFRPIADRLAEPLRTVYADRTAPEARDRAFTLLYEFATRPGNPTQAEDLAALVGDADAAHFRQVLRRLDTASGRARARALLAPRVRDPARFDDELARRQGRWALALLRLGRDEAVWPLYRHRHDPGVRTELIHNLARFGFDPAPVIARLRGEADVSARRALILCLGEFPVASIAGSERRALSTQLLGWYRADPDPGVHGAVDWLLRQKWGLAAEVDRADRELAREAPPKGRDWYVNGRGQTFAIVRGPVEFRMGSTRQSDPGHRTEEAPHVRRIGRPFAIAAREVTVAEYGAFLADIPDLVRRFDEQDEAKSGRPVRDFRGSPQFQQDIPGEDCAMATVTWYEAARYCNWLSAKEGLPEGQWCYPGEIGPGMRLPADHLERTGYRLPTEAEWEYACRAGAASARPYGGSEAWLPEFGWSLTNSGRTMHPVGRLKPNDLGLFDVLGNAYERCADPFSAYRPGKGGAPSIDELNGEDFLIYDGIVRVLRGGSFNASPPVVRAADRVAYRPSSRNTNGGFRPCRTYPSGVGLADLPADVFARP
jgi:formylglycine-generating enzyme required for sulfatase activity